MIGKAAFWLGLLVLLTPHEPDLGLGRPSAVFLESDTAPQNHGAPHRMEAFAANLPRALLSLRGQFLRRSSQMRAEIRYSLSQRNGAAAVPSQDVALGSRY